MNARLLFKSYQISFRKYFLFSRAARPVFSRRGEAFHCLLQIILSAPVFGPRLISFMRMNYLFISPRNSFGFLSHLFDYPSSFNQFTRTLNLQGTQTYSLFFQLIPKPKNVFLVVIVSEGTVFQLHIPQSNIGIF
jgi:hypothetical protein